MQADNNNVTDVAEKEAFRPDIISKRPLPQYENAKRIKVINLLNDGPIEQPNIDVIPQDVQKKLDAKALIEKASKMGNQDDDFYHKRPIQTELKIQYSAFMPKANEPYFKSYDEFHKARRAGYEAAHFHRQCPSKQILLERYSSEQAVAAYLEAYHKNATKQIKNGTEHAALIKKARKAGYLCAHADRVPICVEILQRKYPCAEAVEAYLDAFKIESAKRHAPIKEKETIKGANMAGHECAQSTALPQNQYTPSFNVTNEIQQTALSKEGNSPICSPPSCSF